MSRNGMGEQSVTIPPCPACTKPLGLYYAECQTCFAWAHVYTLDDYARVLPPRSSDAGDPS